MDTSAWAVRDWIVIVTLVLNVGSMFGVIRYVLKTVERDLADIFTRLRTVEALAAKNEGRLNGAKK